MPSQKRRSARRQVRAASSHLISSRKNPNVHLRMGSWVCERRKTRLHVTEHSLCDTNSTLQAITGG
jgi:hypothetical protein